MKRKFMCHGRRLCRLDMLLLMYSFIALSLVILLPMILLNATRSDANRLCDLPTNVTNLNETLKIETGILLFTTFLDSSERIEIQKLVIQNWSHFQITCVVFVHLSDNDSCAAFKNLMAYAISHRWVVFPVTASNSHGTPYFLPMLRTVVDKFNASFYGYANGDILFDAGLIKSLFDIARHFQNSTHSVFITGQRRSITLDRVKNRTELWRPQEVTRWAVNATLWSPYAADFFFMNDPRKLVGEDFINVVVGRTRIDNYLIYRAKTIGYVTIDVSSTVTDLHVQPEFGRAEGKYANDGDYNTKLIGKTLDKVLTRNWVAATNTTAMFTAVDRGSIQVLCRPPTTFDCKLTGRYKHCFWRICEQYFNSTVDKLNNGRLQMSPRYSSYLENTAAVLLYQL